MKNSLLALALSLSSASVFAQNAEIIDLNPRTFSGIQINSNREVFYTAYSLKDSKNNTDSVVAKIWNRELMDMGTIGLSIPKSAQVAGYAFTNEFLVFLVNDVVQKTQTTYVLDMQGNVISQSKEENVKPAFLDVANAPLLFSSESRTFVKLQKGQSNGGYTIEAVDIDFKRKWTKSFSPENESWEIVQTLSGMDRLYLLRKELASDGKYAFSVQAISLNDGNVLFTTPLKRGVNGQPVFMQLSEEMTLNTAGVFLKNGKSGQKADGLFFASIDPSGRMIQYSELPWETIKGQLTTGTEQALIDGKTNVLIQGVVPTFDHNGHILVSEVYDVSRNSKDKTASFNVGDIVLYQLGRDGNIVSAKRIEKAPCKLVVKTNTTSDLELAEQMYRNGYFSYRSTAGQFDKQYAVCSEGADDRARLRFYSLSDTVKANIVGTDLGAGTNTSKIIDLNAKDLSNMDRNQNVIPLREGKIMSYSCGDNRLTLRIQPVGAN